MVDQHRYLKPREDAGHATAEKGVVILDGPDGVAVTMTADAAERTAKSLQQAAREAREDASESGRSAAKDGDEGVAT